MFDFCVIGGGIVGVSVARHIARLRPGASVVVLEKERELAQHQTGHNSGVIHSGIYYEPGSLKARYCRSGAQLTRELARELDVPFRLTGKLIVATDDVELSRMRALKARAVANSIVAHELGAGELASLEPEVAGRGALLVEETGVIDYGLVTRRMADVLVRGGVDIRTGVTVVSVSETVDHVAVRTLTGEVRARRVVACAGLQADRVAKMCGIDNGLLIVPFRGEYFQLPPHRADLVKHLIYPVPDPALPFLGVHLTPTIDGGLTVGPNAVLGLAREKYPKLSVDRRDVREMVTFPGLWHVARAHARTGVQEMWSSVSRHGYLRRCRVYCPALTIDDLQPREAGIRAQAVLRDGTLLHDFLIERTDRTVHVLNAPSPAATSALPIGRAVAEMVMA